MRVRYFAAAAEAAGRRRGDPRRCPDATVGELRDAARSRYGDAMARVLRTGSFLVDGVVSRDRARTARRRASTCCPVLGRLSAFPSRETG